MHILYKKNPLSGSSGRMLTWQRVMTACLAIVTCFMISGCGGDVHSSAAMDPDRPIRIGVTFDSLVIERWERDRDVFVSTARELGAEVNVQNANGDVNTQRSQIEYFMEKKMQAIVIVATDCDSLSSEISKAHRAGIKVVSYDRLINNAGTDLFISFDNRRVGELMAEGIIERGEAGDKVLQIGGPLTDSNVPAVMEGFDDKLQASGMETVKTYHCDNWRPEYAFDYVNAYLKENPDDYPDAIMCGNDSIAGQAIKALSERKLAGRITVTGQDADLDACQRIVEGTQYMTVYKPVEKLAQRAAELTVRLVQTGSPAEDGEETETVSDGTYDVPYVKLEPIKVTAENMDEVIIGSFHQREEVYLNVE